MSHINLHVLLLFISPKNSIHTVSCFSILPNWVSRHDTTLDIKKQIHILLHVGLYNAYLILKEIEKQHARLGFMNANIQMRLLCYFPFLTKTSLKI